MWTYPTQGHISSSPAVYEGVVYMGSWDHNVYALGTPQSSIIANGADAWTLVIIVLVVLVLIGTVVLVFFRQKTPKNSKM